MLRATLGELEKVLDGFFRDAADVAAGVWEEVVRKADHYEDRGWPLSA